MNDEPTKNYDPKIRDQYASGPKFAHLERVSDPAKFAVSADNQQLHEQSVQKYPHLNLTAGEFVLFDVKRHPIGLLAPVLTSAVVLLAIIAVLILYPANPSDSEMFSMLPSYGTVFLPLLIVMLLVASGGAIAVWVYLQNRFYLTNESVIQIIQQGLLSRREQTVSLGNIEDASFTQAGVMQMMLGYGSIRLSTEGDETTYRFRYVTNPRDHVASLNNAIESFKNGRPVEF